MKIFISSVVRDFGPYRDAATQGARTLRHEVKRSEDFGASPDSSQRVCLAGVRACDVTILLLGATYGQPQGKEQLSPTHEEYREARDHKDVLVFIQQGVAPEPRQEDFIREVQAWSQGKFTANFSTPEDLQQAVIRDLHDFELSRNFGPIDELQLQKRAQALIPREGRGQAPALVVVVSGAPEQPVLRPAQLEASELADRIIQNAMFGKDRIFDRAHGSDVCIENHSLSLQQERASILLTPIGDVRILLPAHAERQGRSFSLPALIEEDVRARIARALRFVAWLLDDVDPKRRLHTILPVVAILEARYTGWKTLREHESEPNRMTMSMSQSASSPTACLTPASRPRAALSVQADVIAEDLTVLLRRQVRTA